MAESVVAGLVVPMPTRDEKYDWPDTSKMLFMLDVALSPMRTLRAVLTGYCARSFVVVAQKSLVLTAPPEPPPVPHAGNPACTVSTLPVEPIGKRARWPEPSAYKMSPTP